MTAPTWAEARRAERKISAEEVEHVFYRYMESKAAGDAYKSQAEAKVEAARRASDLALVRAVLVWVTQLEAGVELDMRDNVRDSDSDETIDPAAVLAALEQEGR